MGVGLGRGRPGPERLAAPAVLGKGLTAWTVLVPSQRGLVYLVYARRWGPFHLSVPSSSTRHGHCRPLSWGHLALLITPRLGCKHRLLQDLCPRLGGRGPPCAPASPTVPGHAGCRGQPSSSVGRPGEAGLCSFRGVMRTGGGQRPGARGQLLLLWQIPSCHGDKQQAPFGLSEGAALTPDLVPITQRCTQ